MRATGNAGHDALILALTRHARTRPLHAQPRGCAQAHKQNRQPCGARRATHSRLTFCSTSYNHLFAVVHTNRHLSLKFATALHASPRGRGTNVTWAHDQRRLERVHADADGAAAQPSHIHRSRCGHAVGSGVPGCSHLSMASWSHQIVVARLRVLHPNEVCGGVDFGRRSVGLALAQGEHSGRRSIRSFCLPAVRPFAVHLACHRCTACVASGGECGVSECSAVCGHLDAGQPAAAAPSPSPATRTRIGEGRGATMSTAMHNDRITLHATRNMRHTLVVDCDPAAPSSVRCSRASSRRTPHETMARSSSSGQFRRWRWFSLRRRQITVVESSGVRNRWRSVQFRVHARS